MKSLNKSVVIFGPPGCGKTRNGHRLAKHFGLRYVFEGDYLRTQWPVQNALILTNEKPPAHIRRQLSFDAAMALLSKPAAYPF